MARFLNTKDFNHWLNILITSAKKELVLIVPYIKISDSVNEALLKADKKGVNIVIVYRENKLSRQEKLHLLKLENLNLLHHPNIHCKAYFNGELMIIGSMNLHSYSQNNNREMGALFSIHFIDEDGQPQETTGLRGFVEEDVMFIDSSLSEFTEIINSSELEYQSEKAKQKDFRIEALKTIADKELEYEQAVSTELNKVFLNKKFAPKTYNKKNYFSVCENYFDDIEVIYEERRFSIRINKPEDYLKKIFEIWKENYNEFEFVGFKYYWGYHLSDITIYKDTYRYNWDPHLNNFQDEIIKFKEGIDLIIKKYRFVKEKARKLQLIV